MTMKATNVLLTTFMHCSAISVLTMNNNTPWFYDEKYVYNEQVSFITKPCNLSQKFGGLGKTV